MQQKTFTKQSKSKRNRLEPYCGIMAFAGFAMWYLSFSTSDFYIQTGAPEPVIVYVLYVLGAMLTIPALIHLIKGGEL